MDYIRAQILIRYGRVLYHNYDKGSLFHFGYGVKRILIEIAKSYLYLLLALKKRKLIAAESIAIYSTNNQEKALTNAYLSGVITEKPTDYYMVSLRSLLIRALAWTLALIVFPCVFPFSKEKAGSQDIVLLGLRKLAINLYIGKLKALGVKRLFISNDHQGDVFLLSILLRQQAIRVCYVQHGAVKREFPENYFHEIYIYESVYLEIYKALARRDGVNIFLCPEIAGVVAETELKQSVDVLICLSHKFRMLNNYRLLMVLRRHKGLSVSVRFHPSDRLKFIKYRVLSIFHPLLLSDEKSNFIYDFSRAKIVLCAASSLLLDAYRKELHHNMYWLKPIGLAWDYYDLGGKINTLERIQDVSGVLSLYSVPRALSGSR